MFGGLSLSEDGAELPAEIAHIARDPFDPAYDLDAVVRRLRRKRTGIKRALLDQQLIAGVGQHLRGRGVVAGPGPLRPGDRHHVAADGGRRCSMPRGP